MVEFTLEAERPPPQLEGRSFHEWMLPDGSRWTQFFRVEAGYLLRFPGLSDFWVSDDGMKVNCFPAPGVAEETSMHLYLNQVLPLALANQGKLVFHASAVEIGDVAVAFAGESGRGKSTLAASFATSGFRFLTDDGLVLEPCLGGYQVMPSHPSIRLWEDSRQALIKKDVKQAPPLQFTSKARFLAGDGIVFCEQPRPLQVVYFIGERSRRLPAFERMKPADALVGMMNHSFLLDIEDRDRLAVQFDELSSLACLPMFYRLDYPRRFEDLALVRQAIIDHVQSGRPH